MANDKQQASPATIGKPLTQTRAQREAIASYGPADIEAMRQFVVDLPGGTAKQGGKSVTVTGSRAEMYFSLGAEQ